MRTVTRYDFRRPITLSREHSRILQVAFDGFARQATTVFTSSLRRVTQVSLRAIEQRTYGEYVDSLPGSTYLTIFSAEPLAGLGVLELPLPAVMSCLDHMLGGPGGADQPLRPLTDIESGVIAGFITRLLGEMRYSLEGVARVNPTVVGTEYSPQFAQVASAAEVVVVLRLAVEIEALKTELTICLPFNGLLPHLVAAAAPAPVSDRERAKRHESERLLRQQFEEVPIEVSVHLRSTRVSPGTLSGLAVGDVLRLSHPASAPLEVRADETTFALATAGSKRDRLAALIVGTSEETS